MKFGPDDEAAYTEAREQLVDELQTWAGDPDPFAAHVGSLLDFKWAYADGDLLTWRAEHVEEFLVDWLPRKVTIPDDAISQVAPQVAAFFAFLDATARLGPRSDPASRLVALTESLGADLEARIRDRSNWGPGKALAAAMEADGVEIGDQDAMDAWVHDFNSRTFAEREAVLGPAPPLEEEEPVALTPRPRPDPAAVAAVARDAPLLATMLALSDYLGAGGRPLTKKGNLKMVDGRALVELLGTGDEVDDELGGRVHTVRSAEELPHLDTILRWAKEARVVRVVTGTLHGTASFRKLARDPVAAVDRLVDALFDVGPLLMHRLWTYPSAVDIELYLDAAVVSMLMTTYNSGRVLHFEYLVERAADEMSQVVASTPWPMSPELLDRTARDNLGDAFRGLEQVGVVAHRGWTESQEELGLPVRVGGTIELTALGVAAVQRIAPAWGFEAPVTEPFSATAGDEPVVVVRALRDQLDAGGPGALVAAFDALGPAGGDLMQTAWRVDDPAVLPVLEALGRNHLDRPTARAARKAVFRHRSWLANRS